MKHHVVRWNFSDDSEGHTDSIFMVEAGNKQETKLLLVLTFECTRTDIYI
jgi:hypothetical protein